MNQPILDEHDDDQPIGRVLSRREVLALLGGGGAALVVGAGIARFGIPALAQTATPGAEITPESTAIPDCVVRPAKTEGPYFVDGMLNRSDIRIDPTDGSIKEGVVLRLIFRVQQLVEGACTPLPGAQVDLWHCDALGVYSGVRDRSFDTSDQMWLRGYQVTDDSGLAEFITVYPGWYSGRAVHMHFKIRTDPEADSGYEFTSQLFFDEALTDEIHSLAPYDEKGYRNVLNAEDNFYGETGALLLLNILPVEADADDADDAADAEDEDDEAISAQYTATFDIALDLSAEA